eukprot:6214666-Pleurochrysis_carterae.AAC.1
MSSGFGKTFGTTSHTDASVAFAASSQTFSASGSTCQTFAAAGHTSAASQGTCPSQTSAESHEAGHTLGAISVAEVDADVDEGSPLPFNASGLPDICGVSTIFSNLPPLPSASPTVMENVQGLCVPIDSERPQLFSQGAGKKVAGSADAEQRVFSKPCPIPAHDANGRPVRCCVLSMSSSKAAASHKLTNHLSKIRCMKSGDQALSQRPHGTSRVLADNFAFFVDGMLEEANATSQVAYCAARLSPSERQVYGCRRAYKPDAGPGTDLAGFCNATLQKTCFRPKSFCCTCLPEGERDSPAGSWKKCSCNNAEFQAAVDAEKREAAAAHAAVEAAKREAKRQGPRRRLQTVPQLLGASSSTAPTAAAAAAADTSVVPIGASDNAADTLAAATTLGAADTLGAAAVALEAEPQHAAGA